MISALMANLRTGTDGAPTVLGYLSPFTAERMRNTPAAHRYFEGARKRAESLGYMLEFFCCGPEGLSDARLTTILQTRAIRGILIAPGTRDHFSLNLPWESFCAATLGYTFQGQPLPRAVNRQYHSIGLALRQTSDRGYRRVALLLSREDDARTDHLWQAGYLVHQQSQPASERLPIGFLDDLDTPARLAKWFERYRPDAVMLLRAQTRELIKKSSPGLFKKVGLVLLDRSPEHDGIAGVDQRPDLVGAAGIDLVVKRLIHNEFEVTSKRTTMLIEGEWVDDTSLPDRSKPSKATQSKSKK